jgi:hypothetical protein
MEILSSLYTYEGESVNRLEMDIKRKTRDIRNVEKKKIIDISSINSDTLVICHMSPVRRNPQHTNLLTVVSATSAPEFQHLRHQRNICHQGGFFADQTGPS